mmetsp:Transcript_3685/g.8483  ORF Transcript_3685/g.8483 Transcript_3685/m.8483 type:complete len:201 (-) Transcript_3685:202-804(-)|eukprot:CAMPEP_0113621190 /NCGR_PEP_ID=MMETSP0017_2-20120614/10821_1 /TAXON_ID=2856 /ORGANISM="Cylindrotheca closterium" /LENGTH=200 /DNA_ID=CAMNT_0000530915 /DNA_START=171 /DNA_END=773 /DNA_ORIENTATION=+ /assembly_acc=CAM_ASM_000147
MTSISAIIEKNNQTIAFFNANDYLNAIESSTLALTSLREASENNPPENDEESNIGESHAESSDINRLDEYVLLSAVSEHRRAIHDDTTNSDYSIIYDHGISIPPSATVDIKTLSAILIFNTALAHHLAAESQHTPTPTEALHKAKDLYRLAYYVDTSTRSMLFEFAVINNLGVVERTLGYTAVSNQLFDYLAYLLENSHQ